MPRRKTAVKRILSFDKNMVTKKRKTGQKENVGITNEEGNKLTAFEKKCEEFETLRVAIPEASKLLKENVLTIGAHVSVAGGLHNGPINAYKIKATAFAFFPTPPRKWTLKKVLTEGDVDLFNRGIKTLGYRLENIVPHGNYLVNLGSPDTTVYDKSYSCFVTELKICEQLSIPWLNIHPGSATNGCDREACVKQIGESINAALKETSSVVVVLENMCKQGNTVGGDLSELGTIISHVTDKTRVGVCLDTCHAMAAGYDISTDKGIKAMFAELDKVVGMQYLKAFHLNDKKGKCDDHKDRHELLGEGCIKFPVFKHLVKNYPKIPMILETPDETIWEEELSVLRKLYYET